METRKIGGRPVKRVDGVKVGMIFDGVLHDGLRRIADERTGGNFTEAVVRLLTGRIPLEDITIKAA